MSTSLYKESLGKAKNACLLDYCILRVLETHQRLNEYLLKNQSPIN